MADPSAAESPSILLVSTRRASRDEIAQILDEQRRDTRLFWVSQPDLAVVRAQDLVARIILVDADLGGASQAALIQELSSRLPDAAVLALVDAGAMGSAREALLAGARAFVTRPLGSYEMASALHQLIARPALPADEPQTSRLGRLVVFCGPKGGTGRTTAAINTALSLRQVEDRPLALVDADYAAPAVDVQLNLHETVNVADLLPRIAQLDRELIESVLVEHPAGLRVLLAPPPADVTVHISLPQLEQILLWLKRMFPWVVVDLGLPIDELALGFLDAADLVIMSANPEMIGLRNAQLMTAQFRARGYPEDKVWLLLNRADLYGGLRDKDVREYLGLKVRHRIPNNQMAATDNVNRGIPFVLANPRSPVARAYLALAREVVRCLPPRTWSTAALEFPAKAEAATAAELASREPAPARPSELWPDEREPDVLLEASPPATQPEGETAVLAAQTEDYAPALPSQPRGQALEPAAQLGSDSESQTLEPPPAVADLVVEPAAPGAAYPAIEDGGPGDQVLVGEFVAMAEVAAELASGAPAPVPPAELKPDEEEPGILFEAGPPSAQPDDQIPAQSALAVEPEDLTPAPPAPVAYPEDQTAAPAAQPEAKLVVEPAAAGTANLAIRDDGSGGQDLPGGPATGVATARVEAADVTANRVAVPARRDAVHQAETDKRSKRLPAVREWAGLVLGVLAIIATLGVLGFAVSRIVASQRQRALVARLQSLSPTPGLTEAVAALAPASTWQPTGTAVASPTPSAAAAAAGTVAASLVATPTVTATPTVAATPTDTVTPVPSSTPTEAPTATATLTSTPEPSPTVALPTATLTRRPTARPTFTPRPSATAPPAASAPLLLAPEAGASQRGATLFQWEPTAPLSAGTGYEVVWWNNGENPTAARGFAPPVATASLSVDLDVLFNAGQLKGSDIFWTVLVVTTDPYARLTQPDTAAARLLVYQPGGQGSGEPPPKVR